MSITSGGTHNLTCSVQDARPPAELKWHYPEEVQVRLEDRYNGVYGDAYTSRRVVSVTPSRDDDGKILRCVASHRELDNGLQLFIHLDVQGDYLTNNIIPWLLGVRARARVCACVCLSVCSTQVNTHPNLRIGLLNIQHLPKHLSLFCMFTFW